MKEDKVTKGRKILYVDASFNTSNNEAKISLYDKERNKLDTLLLEDISSSAEAEKYAIVYACIYTKKKNIVNRKVHILNDNHNATLDENILKVCKYFNVNVSWIPREINEIADKGSKLEVNIRESESNYLKLFYDILMKNSFVEEKKPLVKEEKPLAQEHIVGESDKIKNILKNAIRHSLKDNKAHAPIGEVGKYLKENNPTFKYNQLKKLFMKYPNDFIIVDNNFIAIKS